MKFDLAQLGSERFKSVGDLPQEYLGKCKN
jgi:hypothetical protein